MSKSNAAKKASRKDWHSAEILCALRLAGWTLASLSIHHGYASRTTLGHALHRPWPKGERLIAAAIGADPQQIWPSRYAADSTPANNAGNVSRPRRRVTDRIEALAA